MVYATSLASMIYRFSYKRHTYVFPDLATLMAKASPLRSGDVLAGLAATSAEERAAAQGCLAEVPLTQFLVESLIPPEQDEVSRLILTQHDPLAFRKISAFSVGEFRDWLLRYDTETSALSEITYAVTPEMVAAVSKLMRNQDLILAARVIERLSQRERHVVHRAGAGEIAERRSESSWHFGAVAATGASEFRTDHQHHRPRKGR